MRMEGLRRESVHKTKLLPLTRAGNEGRPASIASFASACSHTPDREGWRRETGRVAMRRQQR